MTWICDRNESFDGNIIFVSVLAKRGPPPLKHDAKRKRGAGLVSRREFRVGVNLTEATARAYRTGFNTMWKYVGAYMARKGIKRPGGFDRNNVHGGRLWASRKECNMTNMIAGNIIERVYDSGKVGLDQLKQVRHSMSYAYYLTEGIRGENYPEVNAQWKSFNLSKLPGVRRTVKPTRIPTPANLKTAFTTEWTSAHPQSLATFSSGVLCAWDTQVFGLRPNVDVKKVKTSSIHDINPNEGHGWTQMVGGRSKLHLQKRGTRPWRVYRVCTCRENHVSPPEDLTLDQNGNPLEEPSWNTVCPLAAMELLQRCQGDPIRIYTKWLPTKGEYGNQNIGDVASFANEWLSHQGVPGPFDRNSGRKSLARWLELLRVPYPEGMQIHGDLELVWRNHYEKRLLKSGLKTREQSEDPDTATRALFRFAHWLHQDDLPKPSLKQQLASLLDSLD